MKLRLYNKLITLLHNKCDEKKKINKQKKFHLIIQL